MLFIISVLSIYVFIETLGYAYYEFTDNSNKSVSIIMTILAFISLIGPVVVEVFR